MQMVVLNLHIQNDRKSKQKAMKIAASILGVDHISLDIKEKKLTLVGCMDPVEVVKNMRKTYKATIETVGPAKSPEKPKEEPKDKVLEVHHYPVYPVCPRCYYCCYPYSWFF